MNHNALNSISLNSVIGVRQVIIKHIHKIYISKGKRPIVWPDMLVISVCIFLFNNFQFRLANHETWKIHEGHRGQQHYASGCIWKTKRMEMTHVVQTENLVMIIQEILLHTILTSFIWCVFQLRLYTTSYS